MTPYEQVLGILRVYPYDWTVNEGPHPDPTAIALETQTPEQVAHTLGNYVQSAAANMVPPYGAQESNSEILRRRLFSGGVKYWSLNTSIALGQQVEIQVPTEGPAQSPTDWWNRQERLVNRIGEALCSAEEFARRNAYASLVPLEWRSSDMDPVIYQLAAREGYLPVGMEGFDPAYLQSTPRLKDVRGLSAYQWMENLRDADLGRPPTWLPGGARNPKVKP